ncbi:MAG: tRNA (adenosine(37)-N6)-threonylcarbamoyltransferase complex ATPase subunit type 1 TsaE [Alphaproteobacteria bacterium]|nr:tRNA (adenosine(37)-N6)-threonylcarbamoyltransferase complex ATPase subunit type 1 TsaE [Alphaproteobacteria bacterium]
MNKENKIDWCDFIWDSVSLKKFAQILALYVQKKDVIALYGDLGTGKTTFARAFIQALTDNQQDVPSPTFTLVQTYEIKQGTIWHFDLYRLKSLDEAYQLNLEEAFHEGISLIEWPQRLENILPEYALKIYFNFNESSSTRKIKLYFNPYWISRGKNILLQIKK